MSILCRVFSFIIICISTNCKLKNAFLQRTSTKTILTKEKILRNCRLRNGWKKCASWKRRNEKRRKTSGAFFRAIFPRVKICDFLFPYYKTKENRNDCTVLQMFTFFGWCTFVMCISWIGYLMYWSEAVRSVPGATSEARRERTTVYRSEQAVIGLSPMLIF